MTFGASANTSAGITVMCHLCHLMQMATHNQISHTASSFDCFDLRNAMVPLMIPLTSCDTSAGTNVVT